MTEKQLDAIIELIDMPKRELRLLVGADNSESDRLDETRGWTRGNLIRGAIDYGLLDIEITDDE